MRIGPNCGCKALVPPSWSLFLTLQLETWTRIAGLRSFCRVLALILFLPQKSILLSCCWVAAPTSPGISTTPVSVLGYTANAQTLRDMNMEELHTPEHCLYAADTDYAIISGEALEKCKLEDKRE